MNRKDTILSMKRLCALFIIIGLVFICLGFYKKQAYHNPDSEYSYNKNYVNSYVGGDAYNYIINGTYFTAYSVIGMGSFIIASIFGVTSMILAIEDKVDSEDDNLPVI